MDLEALVIDIKSIFNNEDVKASVLDNEWLVKNKNTGIHSTGFCFSSCEVIYRLTGGKNRWFIKSIDKSIWDEGTHYFLQDKLTNEILDVTSDQYTDRGIDIPYTLGKAKGLRNVSNRAKKLASFLNIEFKYAKNEPTIKI